MKKMALLVLIVAASMHAFSQNIKLHAVSPKFKNDLPAALHHMVKGETYRVTLPQHLKYWQKGDNTGGFFGKFSFGLASVAKQASAKDTAATDYTFELVSPGMENIQEYPASGNAGPQPGIITKNITYNMPVSLVVKDKSGKVIKTIIISDEKKVITAVYHANFLAPMDVAAKDGDIAVGGIFNYGRDTVYERRLREFEADYLAHKIAVYKRIELNYMIPQSGRAQAWASAGFVTNGDYFKEFASLYGIEKKDGEVYPDLKAALDSISDAMGDVCSDKEEEAQVSRAKMMKTTAVWNQYLRSANDTTHDVNMKELCNFHLAVCYLFNNDLPKAKEYYAQFNAGHKTGGGFLGVGPATRQAFFDKYYKLFYNINAMKNSGDVYVAPEI